MNKVFISIVLILCLLISAFSCVYAVSDDVIVKVNGKAVTFTDAKPYISGGGRVLIPIRFVAEELGAKVDWNQESSTVVITSGETVISLKIGDNTVLVNDKVVVLDVKPELKNGRTFVPIRFVIETLGTQVDWDGSTRTVFVTTNQYEYIGGYTAPKDRLIKISASEKEPVEAELIITVSYNYQETSQIERQFIEVDETLASKFGDTVATQVVGYIKEKKDIASGFDDKYFTVGAQRIMVSGKLGNNTVQVIVTMKNIEYLEPVVLEKPPFKYYKSSKVNNVNIKPIKLSLKSAVPNAITDTETWMKTNHWENYTYRVPKPDMGENGNIPDSMPRAFNDNMLTDAIKDSNSTFLIYGKTHSDGRYLVSADKTLQNYRYAYDFKNYVYAPEYIQNDYNFIFEELLWAKEIDGILYVSNAHWTYANSSKGMNAYITAINLEDNTVLWRSQPLVCNSRNFVIIDDVIVSGYGFTQEPDYLYITNRYTGEVLNKIKLKSAPEYVIYNDGKLFVRTYDTDYVFKVEK